MNELLLDLLMRRCQVKFTQSAGNPIGSPPYPGRQTKCWIHLVGHGELCDSGWCESPEAALRVAHTRVVEMGVPALATLSGPLGVL